MTGNQLYKEKKFTSWTQNTIAEALCDEWSALNPELHKDIKVVYGFKANRIFFRGEVNVTIDMSKSKFPEAGYISPLFNLSLSPDPDDLSTHVLNTFNFIDFVGLFPELSDRKKLFIIEKTEPWEGSQFARATHAGFLVIETLLNFDTCFNFLTGDTCEIGGETLDMKKLGLALYLNAIKAYRLAEIYGHPEKLDEAIQAIKKSSWNNDQAKQRLEKVCQTKSPGGMDWLYTPELIKRLCD